MEKNVELGHAGSVKFVFSGGKAQVQVSAEVPQAALSVGMSAQMDAGALIDELKKALEAKYPGALPIEEAVFSLLKSAVSAL